MQKEKKIIPNINTKFSVWYYKRALKFKKEKKNLNYVIMK